MKNKDITKSNLKKVKELIQNVQGMTAVEFQEVLNKMVRFHNYSLYNQIILCFAGCSQVAGYKKWKELGRTVKKGGRCVWILAPWFRKVKDEKDEKNEERKLLHGFFSVPVFDIAQTEGEPVKGLMTEKSELIFAEVRNFAEKEGFEVRFKPLEISHGGFIDEEKNITLNSNLQEKDWIGTLIHEVSHGLLNHNKTSRSVREQQAETSTYLVCKILGIERKSVFYLKSWGLSENILKDFQKVDRVAKKIIKELGGEDEARNKAIRRKTDKSTQPTGTRDKLCRKTGESERLCSFKAATQNKPRGLPSVKTKQPPKDKQNDYV